MEETLEARRSLHALFLCIRFHRKEEAADEAEDVCIESDARLVFHDD